MVALMCDDVVLFDLCVKMLLIRDLRGRRRLLKQYQVSVLDPGVAKGHQWNGAEHTLRGRTWLHQLPAVVVDEADSRSIHGNARVFELLED